MGGFWALVGHSFSRIFKVSAHLTKAQAEQRGEAAHHASNELADFVAKESLPSFIAVDLETYLRQSKHDAADLFHATNALVLAANASPPMATLDRISKGSIRSIRARWHHEYIWCSQLQRWFCIHCGVTARGTSRPTASQSKCGKASTLLATAHGTHRMFRCRPFEGGSQLFYCGACGCYTQAQRVGLVKPCDGHPATRGGILARLRAGVHPVSRRLLGEASRVYPASSLQSLFPWVLGASPDDSTPAQGPNISLLQPGPAGPPPVPGWLDEEDGWELDPELAHGGFDDGEG